MFKNLIHAYTKAVVISAGLFMLAGLTLVTSSHAVMSKLGLLLTLMGACGTAQELIIVRLHLPGARPAVNTITNVSAVVYLGCALLGLSIASESESEGGLIFGALLTATALFCSLTDGLHTYFVALTSKRNK
jgi:hypothetical protein